MYKSHVIGLLPLMVIGLNAPAASQEYSNKTIRILTSAAGGGTAFAARIIAQGLSSSLDQPVIVDNRPILTVLDLASKAPADGYALGVVGATIEIVGNTPAEATKFIRAGLSNGAE